MFGFSKIKDIKENNDLYFQKLNDNMRIIRLKNGLYQKDIANLLKGKETNITRYEKRLIPNFNTKSLYFYKKV